MPRMITMRNTVFGQEVSDALAKVYWRGGMAGALAYELLHGVVPSDIPATRIRPGERGLLIGSKVTDDPDRRVRVTFKMGRLLRKCVYRPERWKDAYWEELINRLSAALWQELTFEVVRGRDVRAVYHQRNHSNLVPLASLGNSCMRYTGCQGFFQIYWRNPDVCGVLVARDAEGMVAGRALVWTTTDGDMVLDRTYGSEVTQAALSTYAQEQGWFVRGAYFDNGSWEWTKGSEIQHKEFRVQLKSWDFKRFPYLDTFRYLDVTSGILSTKPDDGEYELVSTSGGRSYLGRRAVCVQCGTLGRERHMLVVHGRGVYCMSCGNQQFSICHGCGQWEFRDQLVMDNHGDYYHEQHLPPLCAGTCGERMPSYLMEEYEGRRYCVDCFNAALADEVYIDGNGDRLTAFEYRHRTTCERCSRYYRNDHGFRFTELGWMCHRCRLERGTPGERWGVAGNRYLHATVDVETGARGYAWAYEFPLASPGGTGQAEPAPTYRVGGGGQ